MQHGCPFKIESRFRAQVVAWSRRSTWPWRRRRNRSGSARWPPTEAVPRGAVAVGGRGSESGSQAGFKLTRRGEPLAFDRRVGAPRFRAISARSTGACRPGRLHLHSGSARGPPERRGHRLRELARRRAACAAASGDWSLAPAACVSRQWETRVSADSGSRRMPGSAGHGANDSSENRGAPRELAVRVDGVG